MESLKLTVAGYVQKIGYRQVVEGIARELGITGYVKNLENVDVEIIAQHKDEDVLKKFSGAVNIKKYPIEVKEIRSETVDEEEHRLFKVILGAFEDEFNERMDEARWALDKLHEDNVEAREELGGKMDKLNENLGEKMDGMNENLSGKMDKMGNNLDGFASAVSQRFDVVDTKYGRISEKLEKLDGIDDSLKELVSILRAFKPKE